MRSVVPLSIWLALISTIAFAGVCRDNYSL
jgi:hypothetical protein